MPDVAASWFMEWPTPATAKQHRPGTGRVPEVPCLADFGTEREDRLFVGHIADGDDEVDERKSRSA